jgi:hypothetical protein
MVIDIGRIKDRDYDYVFHDVSGVARNLEKFWWKKNPPILKVSLRFIYFSSHSSSHSYHLIHIISFILSHSYHPIHQSFLSFTSFLNINILNACILNFLGYS